ncbi:hypothetical protein [Veillonella agrestimuris]|uniref:hypothetical protein n=1 Tax=Veillonella agrestimuris TaxID=2941340 RepID=UPI00203EC05D|nr:hypothetical protein [Veillonella agrestimuris]
MGIRTRTHTGLCITKQRITAVSGHIENQKMTVTEAVTLDRKGALHEDITRFLERYPIEDGFYSIVADIKTETTLTHFEPSQFSVKEFIKWNLEDIFTFESDEFEVEVCKREYPRHNYYLFLVAIEKRGLQEMQKGILANTMLISVIDFWPIPVTYSYEKRTGTITGIVEGTMMHIWAWWKDVCIKECLVSCHGGDIAKAMIGMEEELRLFGVEEVEGVTFYNTDGLTEELRIDLDSIEGVYGKTTYMPIEFIGDTKNQCILGELEWDMALGMTARGLHWIGHGW